MENRIVIHIDFDYFFAQCEELRSPELKLKPVCVCVFSDRGNDSGAIATCNYLAREFGVKSGMPIKFAKRKLEMKEGATFLPVDFKYYSEISGKAMQIIEQNGDTFEYVGRDEAYLDVTKKTEGDFDKAAHLGQQLKNALKKKIDLSCSVGISPNKLISKIASDYKKPHGLTIVLPEKIEEFLESINIRSIPGIGKKTEQVLLAMNFQTIKDLKKLDVFTLNRHFGRKTGTYIFNAIRGIDDDVVKEREGSIQFSKIATLKKDSKDFVFLVQSLRDLCNELIEIVQKNKKMFKSVGIQIIQSDMTNKTKSKMLRNPTTSLEELQKNTEILLKEILENQELGIRRLGVKVTDLSEIQGQSSLTSYF